MSMDKEEKKIAETLAQEFYSRLFTKKGNLAVKQWQHAVSQIAKEEAYPIIVHKEGQGYKLMCIITGISEILAENLALSVEPALKFMGNMFKASKAK